MKFLGILSIIVLILIPSAYSAEKDTGEYKLVKQDKIISLYERWIRDTKGEKVRELKAIFFVRSDIAEIVRLLKDPLRGTEWNVNANTYNILLQGDENPWITYIRYSIPWPFGDQDCCLLFAFRKMNSSGQFSEITFRSISHNKFPVQENITRINGVRGKWLMEIRNNRSVKITYTISSNRSAKVPRWISDPIIRNNLFETMTAFKTALEKVQ